MQTGLQATQAPVPELPEQQDQTQDLVLVPGRDPVLVLGLVPGVALHRGHLVPVELDYLLVA